MAMPRCRLAAAAVLLLSISGATACDDYPEEMALRPPARAKLAKAATAQQAPAAAARHASARPSRQATSVAAAVESAVRTAANDGQFGRRVAAVTATVPRAAARCRAGDTGRHVCFAHCIPCRCCWRSAAGVRAHVNERGMDYRPFKDRVGIPCCSKEDCRPAEKFVETAEEGREVVRLLIDGVWITVSRDFLVAAAGHRRQGALVRHHAQDRQSRGLAARHPLHHPASAACCRLRERTPGRARSACPIGGRPACTGATPCMVSVDRHPEPAHARPSTATDGCTAPAAAARLVDGGAVLLLRLGHARGSERDGRGADARFRRRRRGARQPVGRLLLRLCRHADPGRPAARPLRPAPADRHLPPSSAPAAACSLPPAARSPPSPPAAS